MSLLTLATCVSFTPRRLLRIVDWTKGLKERDCIQLDGFMGADLPRPILSAGILKSVDSLLALKVDAKLLRAARWFAAGVRAEAVEEQFQFFYLCLEVMAQLTKSPDPVNDKCAKCGAALLCEKCGVHSTHKPYPKQAIEALFLKIVTTGGNDLFAHANAARNALMHGDSIDEALQSRGVDIVKVVDALGHISHKVLLQAFVGQLSALESSTRMNILMTNMFTHQILTARTHLIVSSADPGNPRLSEIARPTVTLQYPTMPPAPNQSK